MIGVLLTPWMVAGFYASGPLARRLSARNLRDVLLTLATFGALAVLVQTLLHSKA
jgi:uncharacterized protein